MQKWPVVSTPHKSCQVTSSSRSCKRAPTTQQLLGPYTCCSSSWNLCRDYLAQCTSTHWWHFDKLITRNIFTDPVMKMEALPLSVSTLLLKPEIQNNHGTNWHGLPANMLWFKRNFEPYPFVRVSVCVCVKRVQNIDMLWGTQWSRGMPPQTPSPDAPGCNWLSDIRPSKEGCGISFRTSSSKSCDMRLLLASGTH